MRYHVQYVLPNYLELIHLPIMTRVKLLGRGRVRDLDPLAGATSTRAVDPPYDVIGCEIVNKFVIVGVFRQS